MALMWTEHWFNKEAKTPFEYSLSMDNISKCLMLNKSFFLSQFKPPLKALAKPSNNVSFKSSKVNNIVNSNLDLHN